MQFRQNFLSGVQTLLLGFLMLLAGAARAAETPAGEEPWLGPYQGPERSDVDATTLDGKVLCGYQGWFNTPGDGTSFGFTHWGRGFERPDGGRFNIDMWPDYCTANGCGSTGSTACSSAASSARRPAPRGLGT
jgi:hypothetical protein